RGARGARARDRGRRARPLRRRARARAGVRRPSLEGGPMTQDRWNAVEEHIAAVLAPSDAALDGALAAADAAGLPAIQVSAGEGKLLALLARLVRARRILEIGTLAGYSTIWLARAVAPD